MRSKERRLEGPATRQQETLRELKIYPSNVNENAMKNYKFTFESFRIRLYSDFHGGPPLSGKIYFSIAKTSRVQSLNEMKGTAFPAEGENQNFSCELISWYLVISRFTCEENGKQMYAR